jgi:hypothetical protein
MIARVGRASLANARELRPFLDVVVDHASSWPGAPAFSDRRSASLFHTNPPLAALESLLFRIARDGGLRLESVFRAVWGIAMGDGCDAASVGACVDVFGWLIQANAPGTFEMVVRFQVFTLVAGMICSDALHLRLAGLRTFGIAHAVGEQYSAYFAGTDAPIDVIVEYADSETVDLQVGAAECLAVMLAACPEYFAAVPVGMLRRCVARCADGSFRQLRAGLRLLAAALPLWTGECESDFDVVEIVRIAVDTIGAEDPEMSYLCLTALVAVRDRLATSATAKSAFLSEFAAMDGRAIIQEHCGPELGELAQEFIAALDGLEN